MNNETSRMLGVTVPSREGASLNRRPASCTPRGIARWPAIRMDLVHPWQWKASFGYLQPVTSTCPMQRFCSVSCPYDSRISTECKQQKAGSAFLVNTLTSPASSAPVHR